jgi:hypothetical protein
MYSKGEAMPKAKRSTRGGARSGAGAKPKPKDQKQDRHVLLSFTQAEHDQLTWTAGDQPLATYIRNLVLLVLRRARRARGRAAK